MNRLVVGVIAKPQGIKGEVKVQCYVDRPQGFAGLHSVYVAGSPCRILRCRVVSNDVFLTLEGIPDRNAAELLRGKELSVDRKDAQGLKQGEFFVQDLLGLAVWVDDRQAGVIRDVLQYGAADVLVIAGEKPCMVPYLNKLVLDVDLQQGRMTMDGAVWPQVVCYED